MSSSRLALSLVLAVVCLSGAEKLAADCTDTTHDNCNATGCCTVPGTKCFRKNEKWASCRTECVPGPHYNEPPFDKEPWDCIELTGGCNKMSSPCGVRKGYDGTPCCEWGCTCNKTKWGFQCMGTKLSGEYTCDKKKEETWNDDVGENFDRRKIRSLPEAPGTTVSLRLVGLAGLAAVATAVVAGATVRSVRRRSRAPQSMAREVDAEVNELPE